MIGLTKLNQFPQHSEQEDTVLSWTGRGERCELGPEIGNGGGGGGGGLD